MMQSAIIVLETRAEGRSVPAVVTPVGVMNPRGQNTTCPHALQSPCSSHQFSAARHVSLYFNTVNLEIKGVVI